MNNPEAHAEEKWRPLYTGPDPTPEVFAGRRSRVQAFFSTFGLNREFQPEAWPDCPSWFKPHPSHSTDLLTPMDWAPMCSGPASFFNRGIDTLKEIPFVMQESAAISVHLRLAALLKRPIPRASLLSALHAHHLDFEACERLLERHSLAELSGYIDIRGVRKSLGVSEEKAASVMSELSASRWQLDHLLALRWTFDDVNGVENAPPLAGLEIVFSEAAAEMARSHATVGIGGHLFPHGTPEAAIALGATVSEDLTPQTSVLIVNRYCQTQDEQQVEDRRSIEASELGIPTITDRSYHLFMCDCVV